MGDAACIWREPPRRVAQGLAGRRAGRFEPASEFQRKHGHQRQYVRGEYTTAAHMADRVRHDGLTFGLWTAPFEVSKRAWSIRITRSGCYTMPPVRSFIKPGCAGILETDLRHLARLGGCVSLRWISWTTRQLRGPTFVPTRPQWKPNGLAFRSYAGRSATALCSIRTAAPC